MATAKNLGGQLSQTLNVPWEPTTFIFRGYNPYIRGLKPSFFMVLGSKGMVHSPTFTPYLSVGTAYGRPHIELLGISRPSGRCWRSWRSWWRHTPRYTCHHDNDSHYSIECIFNKGYRNGENMWKLIAWCNWASDWLILHVYWSYVFWYFPGNKDEHETDRSKETIDLEWHSVSSLNTWHYKPKSEWDQYLCRSLLGGSGYLGYVDSNHGNLPL